MSSAAKPRKKMFGRLVAKQKKTAGISGVAATVPFEASEPLEAPSFFLLSAAALQAREEKNAADHFAYKRSVLTERLQALNEEEDELQCDEAELVNSQRYAVSQKEVLLRDLDHLSQEERAAEIAYANKSPQKLEKERDAGEPSLRARIELLFDAKREILDRLEDVKDEEMARVDESKKLKARAEDISRRRASVKKILTRLDNVVMGHDYAKFECDTVNQTEKPVEKEEAVAGPIPRIAPLTNEVISRENESPPAPAEGPPPNRARPDEELMLSALLYPVAHEEEVPFGERGAEEQPTLRIADIASTGGSARTHGDDGLPLPGTPISMVQLERAVAHMDFRRDVENNIYTDCPFSSDCKKVAGCPTSICRHFISHLRKKDRPYLCSQGGCQQTTTLVWNMQTHFESRHKELTWSDEIENTCKVVSNVARLNAIQQLIGQRAGPLNGKLSFDQLEEQARSSTLTRHANGINTFKCSVCREVLTGVVKSGWSRLVGQHLKSHLTPDCLPFACPARGCKLTTSREAYLKEHFRSAHEELEWTAHEEKKSVLTANVKRLEAIVQGVLAANPDESGLSLDELEAQSGNITFTRTANGVLRMKCSVCTEEIRVNQSEKIRRHLVSHLRQTSLPVRCPEDGCSHMTVSLHYLRNHLHSAHEGKELTKNMEKDCEVLDNKKRLDAIVASLFSRRPPVPVAGTIYRTRRNALSFMSISAVE